MVSTFGLQHKQFIAVSDKGADMLRLCRLLKVDRIDCLAHGLHNLITADVIPRCPVIQNLLKKLREILSVLRYRSNDLKIDLQLDKDREKAEWLERFANISKFFLNLFQISITLSKIY